MSEGPIPDDGVKKDEIIYELVKRLYDNESDIKKILDDKGSNLIGYITIVTGLLIGLGTFDIFDRLTLPQFYIPYFTGIALFLASIIFSMLTVRVKEYVFVPTVEDLRNTLNNEDWTHRTVMRQFITGALNAIELNHLKNERKASWVTFSWGCLISGLVLVTIYVIIVAIHG
jgi:hypothetical protein